MFQSSLTPLVAAAKAMTSSRPTSRVVMIVSMAAGVDLLATAGGDDRLEGQQGDDILEGGSGHDTYAFQPGDGDDRIFDADGQGEIRVDGEALSGTDARAEVGTEGAVWEAADGTTYTLTDGSLDNGTLEIGGGSLAVFQSSLTPLVTLVIANEQVAEHAFNRGAVDA